MSESGEKKYRYISKQVHDNMMGAPGNTAIAENVGAINMTRFISFILIEEVPSVGAY